MKFVVVYKFARELQERLFVERAIRESERSYALRPDQLTPEARRAALTALTLSDRYGRNDLVTRVPADIGASDMRPISDYSDVSIDAAVTMLDGQIVEEPTEKLAIEDAETCLTFAATVAPQLRALAEERTARLAAEAESKQERAIVEYLASPLIRWLERGGGDMWRVDSYISRRAEGMLPGSLIEVIKLDPRLAARAAEAAAEAERLNAEEAAARAADAAAIDALIRSHATAEQRERWAAGVLPEDEQAEIVRAVLFAPFGTVRRYAYMRDSEIEHGDDCDPDPIVKFSTSDWTGPYSAEQWRALRELRALAPAGAVLDVRRHIGYCESKCCLTSIERYGLRVTIEFAGDKHQREYALECASPSQELEGSSRG